jgi:hypothetical protein
MTFVELFFVKSRFENDVFFYGRGHDPWLLGRICDIAIDFNLRLIFSYHFVENSHEQARFPASNISHNDGETTLFDHSVNIF